MAPQMHNGKRLIIWLLIGLAFFLFLYGIRSVLLPFVIGVMAAYFLDPAADRLEESGLSRTLATVLITVVFFTIIFGALLLMAPLVADQCAQLFTAMPGYLRTLQDTLEVWLRRVQPDQAEALRGAAEEVAGNVLRGAGGVITGIFQSGLAFINVLSLLLITPLVTFYMLRDWDDIKVRADHMLPRAHAATIHHQLRRIDETLAGFIRGQLNVCFLLALYFGISLSILGLSFGLVIGIATGLLVILPYVGFLFMFLIAVGVAFVQFNFTTPFWIVVGIYGFGQFVETYFLTPKLVGGRVGLHPLWIIFGMLAGGAMFGFVGVLLSVPVTAIAGVLIRFAADRYLQSGLYWGR
jgi:predicted PurR-regulated permease PerM